MRLTKSIREAILKDLLRHAFLTEATDMLNRACALAEDVFTDLYGEHLDTMNKLPSCFFTTSNQFRVVFDTDHAYLSFTYGIGTYLADEFRAIGMRPLQKKDRRVPFVMTTNSACKVFPGDHDLTKRHAALKDEKASLTEKMRKARRSAVAVLDSVSTINRLVDVWPEARQFAEAYRVQGERKALLPVVPREELNSALGLPPKGALVAGGEVVS